jgi:hypothetical protein
MSRCRRQGKVVCHFVNVKFGRGSWKYIESNDEKELPESKDHLMIETAAIAEDAKNEPTIEINSDETNPTEAVIEPQQISITAAKEAPTYPFIMFKPAWMKEPLPVVNMLWDREPLPVADTKETSRGPGNASFSIHGSYQLPSGYRFAFVPSDAKLKLKRDGDADALLKTDFAYSYNFPKTALAILQTISAGVTLYRARGSQIMQYGYAAFGLTVTPYLIMSITNLIAQMLTPEYSKIFIVWSPELEEAEHRDGYFDSIVGSLCPTRSGQSAKFQYTFGHGLQILSPGNNDANSSNLNQMENSQPDTSTAQEAATPSSDPSDDGKKEIQIPLCSQFELKHQEMRYRILERFRQSLLGGKSGDPLEYVRTRYSKRSKKIKAIIAFAFGPILVGAMSIVIIAILTNGFQSGHSTVAQRGWVMSWLAVGIGLGWMGMYLNSLGMGFFEFLGEGDSVWYFIGGLIVFLAFTIFILGVFVAPAVGGFVVVIQQLHAYGNCVRL